MVSEREIIRAIAARGAKALDDPASVHMTTHVVTTDENETILEIAEKMNAKRFRHAPVLKDGRLAGIVSIGDVVKYRMADIEGEHEAMRAYISLGELSASAMPA
jgi:CBS domain-containing protein